MGALRLSPSACPAGQAAQTLCDASQWMALPEESGGMAFQGTEKVWRKLRQAPSLADLRIHDLRHSFASSGLSAGDSLAMIGKLLGHADVKTTARYAHLADDPVKQAAARISNSIAAAMGNESK